MKRSGNGVCAFGQTYANELRRRRSRCGDKWHMDEVHRKIHGKTHSLWRAVDQDGNVLDIPVQNRRNKKAAKRFFRKLLKELQYVPRVIITDKRIRYGAAKREILPGVEHRQHKRLNNRAENSHQPTRLREKNRPLLQDRFQTWNARDWSKTSCITRGIPPFPMTHQHLSSPYLSNTLHFSG